MDLSKEFEKVEKKSEAFSKLLESIEATENKTLFFINVLISLLLARFEYPIKSIFFL